MWKAFIAELDSWTYGDIAKKHWEKLHSEQCVPDCPWNWAQETIFPT